MADKPAWYGQMTAESIERMRRRIGVREPGIPAWYREAHPDTMRHFAWSFGDDNPLFSEPEYGLATRWGGIIGAPFYVANLHEPVADPITPEQRSRTSGSLAGLHEFHAGSEFWFYRPVRQGDQARSCRWVSSVEEKQSRFGGGRSVVREVDEYIEDAGGSPLQRQQITLIHTERHTAKEAAKETQAAPNYTAQDIEEIESAILAEERRGAKPRFWEDVVVGDPVSPLTKGPMTITDIIGSHIGRGPGHYAWGPLGLAVKRRRHLPGFYTRNEYGGWDVVQRVHWDQEYSRSIGANRIYDYGTQRQNWLAQAITDWMGDDAVIVRMQCSFKRFNYVGDVSRIGGHVTAKHDDGTVDIELSCVNQEGVDTAPGNATVRLPTSTNPHPLLPSPPTDWPDVRLQRA